MTTKPSRFRKRLLSVLVLFLVVGGVVTAYYCGVPIPGMTAAKEIPAKDDPKPLKVELVKDLPQTLSVPEEVRNSLKIRKGGKDQFVVAVKPKGGRPLVLSATTKFDPASIYRIRARFAPAEVVKIESQFQITEEGSRMRELQRGDAVTANQPLGIFFSVDVGAKKNDLIDALVQMKLDKTILDNAQGSLAIPQPLLLQFERNVQTDINAINRALKYLETWKIDVEEIKEVYREANEIFKNKGKREFNFRRYDFDGDEKTTDHGLRRIGSDVSLKSQADVDDKWGRVVLRSPVDGYIVERNVSEKEIVADQTVNLFTIAKADKLMVLANAPEEQVKDLYGVWKKSGLQWTIRTLGDPDSDGITGWVDDIGLLVDPNQHTVPITGIIPNADKLLRAGQYVTATIQLPPPDDVVEVPANAVVDDGKQTIVFVQVDPKKYEYTMRRVMVTHRFEDRVFVKSSLTAKEKKPTIEEKALGIMAKEPLKEGEHVITSGLLELKKELEDRESDLAD